MDVDIFLNEYEYLPFFPGAKSNSDYIYAWYDSQGTHQGIKALGFRHRSPNKEADRLGLHKGGLSRRGVPPHYRPVDNSKRRGLKALRKSQKRKTFRNAD